MEIKKVNIMSRVHVSIPYGRRITVGGSTVHNDLSGRDATDCHPLASISGLVESLSAKANSADLGAVATSNNYDDLDSLPSIPTDVNDLTDSENLTVPSGGATGQVLAKASNDDNDTEWVDQSGGGGTGDSFQTLTDAANITWDASSGNKAGVTLGGDRTLSNPTNATAGMTMALHVKQDATGSRTLSYGSNFKFPGGITPELSATANATDILVFEVFASDNIRLTNFVTDLQ